MLLTTLHWPDEIRSLGELDLPAEEPEIKPAERKMAEQLIEAMTGEFDRPSTDDYREALLKIIEPRWAASSSRLRRAATNLVDLMAALEASVKAAVERTRFGRADAGRRGQVEGAPGKGRRRGRGRQAGPPPQERLARLPRRRSRAPD
jgi:non-homologous end joining protein Ku